MAGRPKRLSKVASELNVGVSTLIEYLDSQGVQIDSNPNTKLEPAHYEILCEQFAADQSLKEQSKNTTIKREKRETISLKDTKDDEPAQVEEEEEDLDPNLIEKIKAEANEVPQPEKKEETPEEVVEEKKEEAPIAEPEPEKPVEEVKPEPVVEQKEEIVEPPKEEVKAESSKQQTKESEEEDQADDGSPKVVGKIDLSKINTKTRPGKKSAAEKKKEVEQKKATEAKLRKDADVAKAKTAAEEKAKKEKEDAQAKKGEQKDKPEVETIRAESKKLSGPTVLGKIQLPVEKDKGGKDRDGKRKRKRIKKVDPNVAKSAGANKGPGQGKGRFQKGKQPKPEISEKDIQKEIKETLARLSGKGGKSKSSKNRKAKRDVFAQRRQEEQEKAELEKSVLKLTEFVTVSELASMMSVQPTQVIAACMSLGIFASINQRLDAETIAIISEEFGFEAEFVSAEVQESIPVVEDKEEDLIERSPIITVMGHVDHGKTSLLDRIRNANVTEGEAGGITQHIGSYSVKLKDGRKLTFLDTPGHEAFTAMRARGAQVTDVAIIIVAADDDVMPQTKEAISHAQAADVPMIFAINKVDKDGANPDKIREQLSAMNILVEDWGGKYQCQEISAKKGVGIEDLLEKILLEADLLALKANPNKNAVGTVIESSLDKGKGYVTNMLVQEGTLKIGDAVLVGRHSGKVRAMTNDKGMQIKEAGPSQPVSILGINGAPSAGDTFNVLDDEKEAKSISTKREQLYREQGLRTTKHITLDEIGRRLAVGDFKELNIIIKGDVDGSIEALADSLLKLSTEEIQVNVVHKGVGAISEADINLASASDAIVIGFQVRPSAAARKLADQEQIDIRLYSIIYKAIEELKAAMEGMLSPEIEEVITGSAEIRETFNISKVGTIAGCFVLEGNIKRNSKIRVIRDGIVTHTGTLGSLKRFKDDVKEVKHGYECGLNIDKYNDIKEGDIIEAYEETEVARKLK